MDLNNDLRQFRPSRLSGAFLKVVRQVRGLGRNFPVGSRDEALAWGLRAEPPPHRS